jgi:hypothetical protein
MQCDFKQSHTVKSWRGTSCQDPIFARRKFTKNHKKNYYRNHHLNHGLTIDFIGNTDKAKTIGCDPIKQWLR